jgi:very-short-patch-repair endonuclease
VVDFFCFERGLVIELDGGHHSENLWYDAERTRWLEAQGYHVLRFWNNQVFGELQAVKQAILEALTPPPP